MFLSNLKSVRLNSVIKLDGTAKIMGGDAPQSLRLSPPSDGVAFVEYDVPKNLKSARLEIAATLIDSVVSSATALKCVVRVNDNAVWWCTYIRGRKRENITQHIYSPSLTYTQF